MGLKLKRLAPVVLMQDGLAYTTKRFEQSTYLGEPQNLVRIFSELDAHEIIVINLGPLTPRVLDDLKAMSKGSYVPLHFAGNINSADSAAQVTGLGFEKVGIEVRSLEVDLPLISQVSRRVGSTSTSASLSVVEGSGRDYAIWDWKRKAEAGFGLLEAIDALAASGCGELKVTSVDRDGTASGPNLDLAQLIRKKTNLPLVYQGGVGNQADVYSLWDLGIDCVASGTMLSTDGELKAALAHYPADGELGKRWK